MLHKLGQPTIAVVLHLTKENFWPLICNGLKKIPQPMQLFVSATSEHPLKIKSEIQDDFPNVKFFEFDHPGRDISAFLSLLKIISLYDYDLILKLHTGDSEKYSDLPNDLWLKNIISGLLPIGRVELIIKYFHDNPSIGMAGPHSQLWPLLKLLYNQKTIDFWNKLTANRSSTDFPIEKTFFAGAMFWARGSIFKNFKQLDINSEDFALELNDLHGNAADAIERYLPLLAHDVELKLGSFDFSDFSLWASNRYFTDTQVLKFKSFFQSSTYIPHILILIKYNGSKKDGTDSPAYKSVQNATILGLPISIKIIQNNTNNTTTIINEAINNNNFSWLLILDSEDEITRTGLAIVIAEIIRQPKAKLFYTDKLIKSSNGSLETAFLPNYDFDLATSFPWLLSNHFIFSRNLILYYGGFNTEFINYYELYFILNLKNINFKSEIAHISEPLIITNEPNILENETEELRVIQQSIQNLGYKNAKVDTLIPRIYKIDYGHSNLPLVSIVIANTNLQSTQNFLESLLANTNYNNYEILIIDNNSKDEDSLLWFSGLSQIDTARFRIIFNVGPTNLASMYNLGATHALGINLLFINSSIKLIESSWLNAMINHSQRSDVGIVGCKILKDNFSIHHAGYITCMTEGMESVSLDESNESSGNLQRLHIVQSYSAISFTCGMIRKSAFDSIGGFNSLIKNELKRDIDLCLRITKLGLKVVWTPHSIVQLTNINHLNELTSDHIKSSNIDRVQRDLFLKEWLPSISIDLAYNKNFSVVSKSFTVDSEINLSWRPLTWRPDPVILAHPSDDTGCGQYRIMKPLQALTKLGLVDSIVSFRHLTPVELERIQPDSIIFQRPLSRDFLDYMNHSKVFSKAFKIYEIDDLITNIPIKNYFKSQHPKDTIKLLREGISYVDRLIVSTPGLADAYSGWHKDIKILELKLPLIWWGNLNINRTEHKKIRVGWAGGSSHLGDLELISDVVKELAKEVDWIFLGMCPDKLRPFVKEFHSGVPIHMYPQKLASLNLDLAVAPLENNQFNDCKSNLRLLEYGACGFPVICSNSRAYTESNLSVHIVKNKYKDWLDAIRQHISDLENSKLIGLKLQQEVHSNWMLENDGLNSFLSTWTKL